MFNLIKILGGHSNVPEPHTVKLSTALAADVKEGTPVNIAAGALTVLTASTTIKATHIVFSDAGSGAESVTVYDILPGMVFETVLTEDDDNGTSGAPVCLIGTECKITASGVTSAAVASGVKGAVVYDTPCSVTVGSKILVTFPAV